ncbi:MAG: hypothetical protein JNM13_15255 [Hyphomicrobiaceae bacterium]|nr:hypothetical protein [Hyphomicrobiaceae bacterium]
MTTAPDLVALACGVIRAIEAAEPRMRAVGDAMEAAYPGLRCDTPMVMPGDVATAIDALLDAVLGEKWATWYMYDCTSQRARGGASATAPDGTRWNIRTVDDLERLARHLRALGQPPEKPADADWYWRWLDPDDAGSTMHEALRHVPDGLVCHLGASYHAPSVFAARVPVGGGSDETTEIVGGTEADCRRMVEEHMTRIGCWPARPGQQDEEIAI